MYIPKAFQNEDPRVALEFMRRYNFATVVSSGPEGVVASHLPVVVRSDDAGVPMLYAHLARANPQWQHFDGATQGLVIFQGPHAYVSPSLYESHPAVPTWNYQVVHAYGTPEVIEREEDLRAHVLELVEQQEAGRAGRWQPDLPEEFFRSMLRQITGFRMEVSRVEAKFKLGQNRTVADRERMAAAFEADDDNVTRELGAAIRDTLA